MLRGIYALNDTIYRHNPDYFFVKISKSCGRLAAASLRSHSDGNRERILDELVSLSAWTLALWSLENKDDPSFSETEKVLARFKHGCPSCGHTPCDCGDSRFSKVTSFEIVNESSPGADPRAVALDQLKSLNVELAALNLDTFPVEVAPDDKKSLLDEVEKKSKALQALDKGSAATQNLLGRLGSLTEYVENWFN
jgi:hypothetical protein